MYNKLGKQSKMKCVNMGEKYILSNNTKAYTRCVIYTHKKLIEVEMINMTTHKLVTDKSNREKNTHPNHN